MPATLASEFGVGYPIFAFSHCRDVVAEVSRRGGFGVYGAASHTVEELDTELDWIDGHSGGNPYGVDVLLPARTADTGTLDPRSSGTNWPLSFRRSTGSSSAGFWRKTELRPGRSMPRSNTPVT